MVTKVVKVKQTAVFSLMNCVIRTAEFFVLTSFGLTACPLLNNDILPTCFILINYFVSREVDKQFYDCRRKQSLCLTHTNVCSCLCAQIHVHVYVYGYVVGIYMVVLTYVQ